jgi:hypothetical protein
LWDTEAPVHGEFSLFSVLSLSFCRFLEITPFCDSSLGAIFMLDMLAGCGLKPSSPTFRMRLMGRKPAENTRIKFRTSRIDRAAMTGVGHFPKAAVGWTMLENHF